MPCTSALRHALCVGQGQWGKGMLGPAERRVQPPGRAPLSSWAPLLPDGLHLQLMGG